MQCLRARAGGRGRFVERGCWQPRAALCGRRDRLAVSLGVSALGQRAGVRGHG
eukprot:COSAG02_NODE_2264_length_9298_cov_1444.117621_5_plen_53_part_00